MEIFINNTPVTTEEGITLDRLIASQGMSAKGIAVAVNNRVIPRAAWATTPLEEGAKLTVIQAVCGG